MNQPTIILNFDYTFIRSEAMLELAALVLKKPDDRERVLDQLRELTDAVMQQTISPAESIEKQIQLLRPTKSHIQKLIPKLKKTVSASFAQNKAFFKKNAENIYVISYGFKDIILPVTNAFGILPDHIFANTFTYDDEEFITGIDKTNLLAKPKGKIKQAKKLALKKPVYVIGNSFADYEIQQEGLADQFYYYTEHRSLPALQQQADHCIPNLDEFLFRLNIPAAVSYPKSRISVLLLEDIHPIAVSILKEEGYRVEQVAGSLAEEELIKRIETVSILGIRSKTKITANVLQHAKKLLSIGAFCIGTNQFDLTACQYHGVSVFNAPYSNTRSVVEMAIGQIIMLMRGLFDKSMMAHEGKWAKTSANSNEIRGKTLGIIGYGNIGAQLSVLAENLGMNVIYYDIKEKLTLGNAQKCNSMKEVLKKADVITLHVDGSGKKKPVITDKEFQLMKDGAIFLNLARGFLVDTDALAKHIKSGKLRGAAVDVFPEEPLNNSEPFQSVLQNLPNTILTPHVGGSTAEAQRDIAQFVATNIIRFVNTGSTVACVNFPNIQLQEVKNGHRFIHIHKNVPGVLASINNIFSSHKINILGQHLNTNETIGYVITDVAKKYDKQVIEDLKNIPNTIWLRLLY